jgi:hypothetical protein
MEVRRPRLCPGYSQVPIRALNAVLRSYMDQISAKKRKKPA